MTYVINPWFFYLISIVDGLKNLFIGVAIVTGILLAMIAFSLFLESSYCSEEKLKNMVKVLKISLFTFFAAMLLSIFIPSKITLYQIMIAKNITYENIEKTKKEGIKLVDYIIEKTEKYDKKDGD